MLTSRRRIRGLLDEGARRMGLLRWFEQRMHRGLTVLTYHRVLGAADCDGYPFPSLVMPVSLFAEQVAWLAQHTEVLPVTAALDALARPRSRPLVAITFDDGYWDNFEIAAPILEQFGVRATFFVTTNFVRRNELMWFDRAAAAVAVATDSTLLLAADASQLAVPSSDDLERGRVRSWIEAMKRAAKPHRSAFLEAIAEHVDEPALRQRVRPMQFEQVAQLARRGHEIGSHSASHEILPLADDQELETELRESLEALRALTGNCLVGFCYPNGSYDERVAAATRRAGYRYACTTQAPSGLLPEDMMRLGRYDITRDRVSRRDGAFDLTAFRAEICGLHQMVRGHQHRVLNEHSSA